MITRVTDSMSSPVATAATCGRAISGISARDEQSMTNRVTSSGVAPMTADRAAVRIAVDLPDPPLPPMISPPPSSRSNVAGCWAWAAGSSSMPSVR